MLHDFLFDIGRVILNFDFNLGVERIQDRCSKVSAHGILPAIADLTFELESGQITTEEYVAQVKERLGFSGTIDDFIRAFEDIFTLNEEIEQLIVHLKNQGHRLFLLSNTNGIHVPFFTREYTVFEHFAGAVYSHEVGVMKPDSEIYQIAIEKFDLDPARTVYIDDSDDNIAGGRKLGLQAIRYEPGQHQELLGQLHSLGIQFTD